MPLIETEVADGNGGFDLEIIQDNNNSYAYDIEHDSLIGGDGEDTISIDRGNDTIDLTYDAVAASTAAGWTMEDGTVVRNVEKLGTLTTGTGVDQLHVTADQEGFTWYAGGGDPAIDGTLSPDTLYFGGSDNNARISTSESYAADGTIIYTIANEYTGVESTAYDIGNVSIHTAGADDLLLGTGTIGGGVGNDTLDGGAGNDTYYVSNASTVVSEETTSGVDDGGADIVYSTISYTLGKFVENLTLMAAAGNANGTGNSLANISHGNNGDNVITGLDGDDTLLGGGGNDTLIGGTGNDFLDGGPGNDVLTGGDGADRFAFEFAGTNNGVDTVTDYVHGTDSLWFNGADYGVAVGGTLSADMFTAGTTAIGAHGQFIWDASSHTLYWDDDGTGGDAAVAMATFTGVTNIDATDFHFK